MGSTTNGSPAAVEQTATHRRDPLAGRSVWIPRPCEPIFTPPEHAAKAADKLAVRYLATLHVAAINQWLRHK